MGFATLIKLSTIKAKNCIFKNKNFLLQEIVDTVFVLCILFNIYYIKITQKSCH